MKPVYRNILITIAILLLLACAWYFRSIVVYILVSGVLSIMGRPLVDLLGRIRIKKWVFPRNLAALITLIIIWGLILLFFIIFIPLITKQINYFSTIESEKIVQLIEKPIDYLENLFRSINRGLNQDFSIQDFINQKVTDVLDVNRIRDILISSIGILGNIAVAIFSISFITFFFLKDQHLFFESILMWVPDKYTDGFMRALYSIKNLLTRYFIGILIQCTCVMILIDVGMIIAGIDFQQALVMGLIVGILNVIPYIGPWLGWFITLIMGVASHVDQEIVPLIYYMTIVVGVTQFIDNVIFQPFIFSNSVKAHPLEIFIVVLAAGFAAGIPGMIFGIPGYTVLRVFAREFFYSFKPVQKITSGLDPPDTGTVVTGISEEEFTHEKEKGKSTKQRRTRRPERWKFHWK